MKEDGRPLLLELVRIAEVLLAMQLVVQQHRHATKAFPDASMFLFTEVGRLQGKLTFHTKPYFQVEGGRFRGRV